MAELQPAGKVGPGKVGPAENSQSKVSQAWPHARRPHQAQALFPTPSRVCVRFQQSSCAALWANSTFGYGSFLSRHTSNALKTSTKNIFTVEGDRLRHVQKRVKKNEDRHREKLGVDSSMTFVPPRQRTSKEKTETNGGSKRADDLFDMQR